MKSAKTETVPLASLKPHPRNYREHPEDQLKHIAESIKEHGFYRNIVVARDGTILAGHGVVAAARSVGIAEVPVIRLDVDANDPKALKLLAGDNEISRLAEVDDRNLVDMLKELKDLDELLGTGFDDQMLAAYAMVTRTQDEIKNKDEASHWVGMPEHDIGEQGCLLTVNFKNEQDRDEFCKRSGLSEGYVRKFSKHSNHWAIWWPPRTEREDTKAVRYEEGNDDASS